MSSLQRNQSTGPTGATAKDVKREGLASGTDANIGSGLSGLGDPLIVLFGHLPSQRRDSLVNATTTKATTTATTTKRPVLPTAPVSNQEILQMLNTFSNHRVVLGKSQGQAHIRDSKSGKQRARSKSRKRTWPYGIAVVNVWE